MLMSLDTRLTTQDPSIKGGIVVVSAVLPSVFPSVASVIISVGSTTHFINYGLMSPIQPQEVNLYQQKKKKHTQAWELIAISFPNPFYRGVLARCSRIDFLTSSLLAKFASVRALIRVFPGSQLKWF